MKPEFANTRHSTFRVRHLAAGLLLAAVLASAQYAINWYTIDGGGGASTGGVYSVTGTIGQPDAGAMSGGQFTLQGGFWGVVAAIQTEGAPYLSVERMGGNIRISWAQEGSAGFILQLTDNLARTPIAWTNISGPYPTYGTNYCVTQAATSGNAFYRLKK